MSPESETVWEAMRISYHLADPCPPAVTDVGSAQQNVAAHLCSISYTLHMALDRFWYWNNWIKLLKVDTYLYVHLPVYDEIIYDLG